MQIDSRLRAIERQTAAASMPAALATNKIVRNTYLLSAMTLASSALTAAANRAMHKATET